MISRRDFLSVVGVALGSTAAGRTCAAAESGAFGGPLDGRLGLQLWSLREYLPNDLGGTLKKVRAMGFRDVEGAGLWKHTAASLRAALDVAGLRCQSTHMDYERLRDDMAGALAEARAVGASWIVCPWIPHEKTFTREDALKAGDAFNGFGKIAQNAGLRFAYHCHGYEFVPSPEGTLFDTLAGATDPAHVTFQVDVFHAYLGSADPAKLIDQYAARVTSLHLKDLNKNFKVEAGRAIAPPEADIPVGTGQIDMAAVLRAARRAKVALYYIEDESADPLGHIPQSLAYIERVRI